MGAPLDIPDFFMLEAGEALDGLARALTTAPTPPPDDLIRSARLLRGTALMARQQPVARAAAGFETVARRYRERPAIWNDAVRARLHEAVAEFRALVGRAREWSEADTLRAVELGRALELLADADSGADLGDAHATSPPPSPVAPSRQTPASSAGGRPAGVRAFVARESALVVGALDRVLRTFGNARPNHEALHAVIHRMQSLRGLADVHELAPLPELLDGLELAIADLLDVAVPPSEATPVIEAAAAALTQVARDVAGSGRPNPEAPEIECFTTRLIRVFAADTVIVPIETLLENPTDTPVPPRDMATLTSAALVGYGEHLERAADLLSGADAATTRDLRLYRLLGTLRAISAPSSDLTNAFGSLARAVHTVLRQDGRAETLPRLVTGLRDAGSRLREIANHEDPVTTCRRVLDLARRMEEEAVDDPSPVVPIETLLAAEHDPDAVVPIERLLLIDHEDADLPVVAIEELLATTPAEPPGGMIASFRTYRRLTMEEPATLPSLTGFLQGRRSTQPSDPQVASHAPVAPSDPTATGDHGTASTPSVPSPAAVDIETLCYRGPGALERASVVRGHLQTALADGGVSLSTIQPLLDELLDLIPLAAR